MSCAARAGRQLRVRLFATAPSQHLNQAKIEKLRRNKLEEIYKVFRDMEKGTAEYTKLTLSGRVWEEYVQPGNIAEFIRVQDDLKDWLKDLDELRQAVERKMSFKLSAMATTLTSAVAHQSVAFEGNPLTIGDRLFRKIDMSLHR
jgi:hypothetical protein